MQSETVLLIYNLKRIKIKIKGLNPIEYRRLVLN